MAEQKIPEIYLVRHGETAWSLSGQHTSFTDIELTENGRKQAEHLAKRLASKKFAKVLSSPSKRAKATCQLCGFLDQAEILDDLAEWNYGQYEGLKTPEIRQKNPNWFLFRDGAPDGESPSDVAQRANRVIQKVNAISGDVVIFSSGHITRVLGARWVGLDTEYAKSFFLSTASLSILGHERETPVIRLWNDVSHLA